MNRLWPPHSLAKIGGLCKRIFATCDSRTLAIAVWSPERTTGVAQYGAGATRMPVRPCQIAAGEAAGRAVLKIEGLGTPETLDTVQKAWIDNQVARCGYCQSGQIMAAAAFLEINDNPSDQDIDRAMSGNLCRSGTYPRMRASGSRHDPALGVAPWRRPRGGAAQPSGPCG